MTDDLPSDDTHDEGCGCPDCQRTEVFAATNDVHWALLYRYVPDAESGDVATVAAQRGVYVSCTAEVAARHTDGRWYDFEADKPGLECGVLAYQTPEQVAAIIAKISALP